MKVLSSIPAPSVDSIGFVQIYGITMALGMAAAVAIAHYRYTRKNPGSNVIIDMFLPTVIAGIVGARVYHLFTGYDWEQNGLAGTINLRAGGLSIWGAVIFGAVALYVQCRIKKISFAEVGAAVIPGLAIAQAIGRFGNYFNQELFGKPTQLPWALEVDMEFRPLGYVEYSTFHPTFLYEALWCVLIAISIILLEKKLSIWNYKLTISSYVFAYTFGRVFLEWLRIDDASQLFGLRFNMLLSAIISLLAFVYLVNQVMQSKKLSDIKEKI